MLGLVLAGALLAPAYGQLAQVGTKLVSPDAVGNALQGNSVAISSDGLTALVGAPSDDSLKGAAFVYTYAAGAWTQQAKLIPASVAANDQAGSSVALSSDGSTAILGAPTSAGVGSAWVFVRSGVTWSEQTRLTPSDNTGNSKFGTSVALSVTGDVALIGGINDNSGVGAAWIFTRSGTTWTQRAKLTGSDSAGVPSQGSAVALSADGSTAAVGGRSDNSSLGAVWIYKRPYGTYAGDPAVYTAPPFTWSQVGAKLTCSGGVGNGEFGSSVGLSAAGDTLIAGAPLLSGNAGAVWIFALSSSWTQQAGPLVGTGAGGTVARQGSSVSISGDGNQAIAGAPTDTSGAGAFWTFTRTSGAWSQTGAKIAGTGAVGAAEQGYSVSLSGNGLSAVIGGFVDDSNKGAAWFFAAPGTPDLTTSITHQGTFHRSDVGATYKVTVSNIGTAATSTTTTVDVVLPTGVTATAISGTNWTTCTLSPLRCSRNTFVAAGASFEDITVTVDIAAGAPSNLIATATVSGGGETNTSNDTSTDYVALPRVADLVISKTHSGNFYRGQLGATYSIRVRNDGQGASTGTVTVTENIPAGLTLVSMNGGVTWTCVGNSCNRSDVLPAGATYAEIVVTVNVAGNANASVINNATVAGGGETNTANDSANDTTTVSASGPDLTVALFHAGQFQQSEVGATYSLVVTNIGNVPSSGLVTASATIPSSLTVTAVAGKDWTCTIAPVSCTRSDALNSGITFPVIVITATVASNAPIQITSTASVAGGSDGNLANNSSSDITIIMQLAPDLIITKTHTNALAQGQQNVPFTVTVTNRGNASTTGTYTAAELLPTGLTFVSMAGSGWTCDNTAKTCSRSTVLTPGASAPAITVLVNVAANAPSLVYNIVRVSGGGEVNTTNDAATDVITVVPSPDLAISKRHAGDFIAGQNGTYLISVTNVGFGPTSGTVTVTDTLPTGLTAISMAGVGWSCTLNTRTCTRSDALLVGGAYQSISVIVSVALNAAANVTNQATVSGGGDLNTANNTASDPTIVKPAGSPNASRTFPSAGRDPRKR